MSIDKIKQLLSQNSIKDTGWLEKAKWRQENQDWLDVSFAIAVKVASTLRTNKEAGNAPKSQIELAELMGCTPQYINKLLKGQENLQIETICKLQRILDIKLIEVPSSESRRSGNYENMQIAPNQVFIGNWETMQSAPYLPNEFEQADLDQEENQLKTA